MTASYVLAAAGEALLIKVGDGALPEIFTAPATINAQRDVTFSTTEKATVVPRVDNPSAPGKTQRQITATDLVITGQGLLNLGDDVTYANWLLSGAPKNVKVINPSTGMTITGPFLCTDFKVTGNLGDKQTMQLSLKQADLPVVTASA